MKPQTLIPLGIFLLLMLLLGIGLTLDPSKIESPLINKPVPAFNLPSLKNPEQMLSTDVLKGQVSLLNVWASWCISCRDEHEMLLYIQAQKLAPIFGFNYKDARNTAFEWLEKLGDPYTANFFDADGKIGIELGVYGAPETFIIDQNGIIVYKHIGAITPMIWQNKLFPLIQTLRGAPQ